MMPKRMRAIDLYSGIGGWAFGLRLAGIDVVASYEYWAPANTTNLMNNQHCAHEIDIRQLELNKLPSNIDIIVGSPPCTQFSYSNRGGNGDIKDGLKDIIKFLTIVDYLKPSQWAMENVPRVAKIIERELLAGGCLEQFMHLNINTHVINMEDYGLPQRRRRCIAGNFNFDLLASYTKAMKKKTLGEIVDALGQNPTIDPLYGLKIPKCDLKDHVSENALNEEEIRINKAGKMTHPVYNSMQFPDSLNRSARTITATCTRVSRESIIIRDSIQQNILRRLTIRERACLQGFPITFQFYGNSYSQKLRMVGNAIPPSITYYIAQSFKGVSTDVLPSLADNTTNLKSPSPLPDETRPDRPGWCYPNNRRFRFAIPSLRLKSGVRCELVNTFADGQTAWKVDFYFGTSKSIQSLQLDSELYSRLTDQLKKPLNSKIHSVLCTLSEFIGDADIAHMQCVWSHRGVSRTRPFMLLDQLAITGEKLTKLLSKHESTAKSLVMGAIVSKYGDAKTQPPGVAKLLRNAPLILSGLLIGSLANFGLSQHFKETSPVAKLQAIK